MAIELQSTPAVGMQLNLSAARDARKHVELEAQLLSNRIALLKQVEQKTWKITELMRKRTNDINERRTEKNQELAAKEEFYRTKWESIRAAQTQNAFDRDKSKTARDATTKDRMDAKIAGAQMIKQQSHEFLLQKKDHEANVHRANAMNVNFIKQKNEEAQHKLEGDRLAQREKFHADYCSRVTHEERLRACTNALISKLTEEELECIQKLQNTQTVQHDALEKLEAVLGQNALPNLLQRRDLEFKSEKGEKGEPRAVA